MKRIALLSFNYPENLKRAKCYINNRGANEVTLVMFFEHGNNMIPCIDIDSEIKIITKEEFVANDYDLVLPMTDKLVNFLLDNCYPGSLNLNNKRTLQKALKDSGFMDFLKSNVTNSASEFSDGEYVIMKPSVSSGSYSANPLCYRKIKFEKVKAFFDDPSFFIQEFIDSKDIILFTFMCDGDELILCENWLQEFVQSEASNSFFLPFMKNGKEIKNKYSFLIDLFIKFTELHNYTKIKGVFGIQYLVKGDRFVLIDLNMRTGPVLVEVELNNLYDCRFFKGLPFLIGDKSQIPYLRGDDVEVNTIVYSETLDGRRMTDSEYVVDEETRILIKSNKKSGVFRNDYNVYIQRLKD